VQTAFSLWAEGDADLDEYRSLPPPLAAFARMIGGHWYAPYTTGNALLFVLPALAALAGGISPADIAAATALPKLVASVFVATSVGLVHLALRRLVPLRPALFLTLAYALGSNAFANASQLYVEHAASLLTVSTALLLALRGGTRALAGAGLVAGLAVIVRPPNALFFVALVAFAAADGAAAARRLVLWALPPLAFQAVVDLIAFGSLVNPARAEVPLGPVVAGVAGQLVSPSRGLFVYAPWTVLAFVALASSWRGPADRARRLLRWSSLAVVATVILYGAYAEWWGGWTYGNRYLSDLAPLYALALADVWRRGWLDAPLARAALAVAVGWAILLQAIGAGLYYFTWNGYHWDVTPDINVTPWRLWDWTDAQWQFLLRRLVNDPGPAMIVELAVIVACIAGFAILAARARVREAGTTRATTP
jgi:hypothetical protein